MTFMNRKIYFIKKDFQTRFILRFVITATLWAIGSVILFIVMAGKRLQDIRYSPHISVRTTSELLLPSVLTSQVVTLLIFTGILAYAIYVLWKKLSIPLYSIKKDITRIGTGDLLTPVTLREEEFQDLAGDLDRMRNELKEKIARIRDRHAVLSNSAFELQKSILKGNPSVLHSSLLRDAAARLKEELHGFKY